MPLFSSPAVFVALASITIAYGVNSAQEYGMDKREN